MKQEELKISKNITADKNAWMKTYQFAVSTQENPTVTLCMEDLFSDSCIFKNPENSLQWHSKYYVNPKKPQNLILPENFESVILHDQLNDIMNFILDRTDIEQLRMGIIRLGLPMIFADGEVRLLGKHRADSEVIVEDFKTGYYITGKDLDKNERKQRKERIKTDDYPWVKNFTWYNRLEQALEDKWDKLQLVMEYDNRYQIEGKTVCLSAGKNTPTKAIGLLEKIIGHQQNEKPGIDEKTRFYIFYIR